MTIIDMHPDDLLDRELAGTLSPGEQRRLSEHLAQCTTCRLERQLRDDFSLELVAARAPDALQTFVSGALRAALPANGATPSNMQVPLAMQAPALAAPVVPARRAKRRRAAILGVALVIASGAAAAQAGLVTELADFARAQLAKVAGEAPAETTAVAPRAAAPGAAAPSAAAPSAAAPSAAAPSAAAARRESALGDTSSELVNQAPARGAAQGALDDVDALEVDALEVDALEPGEPEPALDEGDAPPARARDGKKARAARSKPARSARQRRSARQAAATPVIVEDSARPALAEASALDEPGSETLERAPSRTRARRAAAPAPEPSLLEPREEIVPARTRGDSRHPSNDGPAIITSSSLFHHANRARHEGLSSEALHSYERLRAEFPSSAEARLSLVLTARMHLDSGRLGDAVEGFDRYIATRDRSLREQALAGRAIALGRLGRTREELAAWQSLLLDYPESSYAAVASQRLRQDQR